MQAFLEQIVALDRALMDAAGDLRWAPATGLFILASAWWVKGPLFVIAGLLRDVRDRMLPITGLAVTGAFFAGEAASGAIKEAVERPRPPVDDPANLDAAIALPPSPSFPSGHATTAFAAATVVAVLVPRWRIPALALAAIVALSRVYLGVHFVLDVVAGALIGSLIGVSVALLVRRLPAARGRQAPASA